jgi:hypothetical protein
MRPPQPVEGLRPPPAIAQLFGDLARLFQVAAVALDIAGCAAGGNLP